MKKGVWLHFIQSLKDRVGIEKFVKRYKDAGFDLIIPCVKNVDGLLDYHSKIGDVRPEAKTWDPLEYMASIANKEKIKLHAWFCVNPEGARARLLKEHPEYVAYTPNSKKAKCHSGYFTCIARQQVRDYQYSIMAEVVENYNVNGIHLDYIRTGDDACFCKNCRAMFKKFTGVDIEKARWWQKEIPAWYYWRISNVTKLVAMISEKCKKEKKELSAAVFHAFPYTMITQSQDFPGWSAKNYLDVAVPMNYTPDPYIFTAFAKNHIANMKGKTELWEGIMVSRHAKKNCILEEAKIAKSLGVKGIVLFEHHHIDDKVLKAVSKL